MGKQSRKSDVLKPVSSSNPADSSEPVESLKPFETIAIAMSGGGFRASAYNLGVLSYLNRARYKAPLEATEKSLLKRVSFLSSASGGTIPAALYAAMNRDVESFTFDKFYNKLYKILEGQTQLEKALEILNDRKNWYYSDDKEVINERNLINAFAKVYDGKDFFDKMTFRIFVDSKYQKAKNEKAHIDEICFNTTELNNGLVFRFQSDGNPATEEHVGNELVYFDKAFYDSTLSKVKLADILAASSCFPGGFEPFMFPQDFSYENKRAKQSPKKTFFASLISWVKETIPYEEEEPLPDSERLTITELIHSIKANYDFLSLDEIKKPKEFGLVDGGVSDNQGLKSLMDADTRRREYQKKGLTKLRPFDLMIISDVDTFMAEPYVSPEENKGQSGFFKEFMSIKFLSWGISILGVLGLLGFANTFYTLIHKPISWVSVPIFIVIILLFLSLRFLEKTIFLWGFGVIIGFIASLNMLFPTISWGEVFALSSVLPLLVFSGMLGYVHYLFVTTMNTQTKGFDTWGRMIKKLKNFFFGIPITSVLRMISARRKSILQLTNDLFMKHIRDEYYFDFFMKKEWRSRRVSNMIYDLSAAYVDVVKKYIEDDNQDSFIDSPKSVYDGLRNGFTFFVELKKFMSKKSPSKPSECHNFNDVLALGKIQIHSETARKMPTTLWFDDQHMKDKMREKLIACGQYTTCHNLLVYTYKLEMRTQSKDNGLFVWETYEKSILDLRKQLWTDWMRFQEDPEFMLKS
jgi:predicted acylesterase/phospholipase RssA